MTGDARKATFELSTFIEFAKAAQLSIESPENASPPHPDIRCEIDGDEYWFELGRITDSNLAKAINIEWPKNPAPFSFAQREPLLRIIEKKAVTHYKTHDRPIDLILHFDQQPPDQAALTRHLEELAENLDALRQPGPFARVWIYDQWSKSILWRST